MTRRNILLVVLIAVVALFFLTGTHNAYAGRCDGNQGNGKGNICEPATAPVKTGNAAEAHRPGKDLHDVYEYTKEVHGYANGNSEAIKWHGKQINGLKANKVDKTEFYADQARQDARASQADLGIEENRVVNVRQDATLKEHGVRLDGHDTDIAQLQNVNAALDTRLGGAYQRLDQHSAQIQRLERKMDRSDEANAVALAVAGHQFNTQGGFQTAISASTVNGKQALAVGMGGALNERVFVNAGVSTSGNTTGGVVSSTYAW